MLYGGFTLVLPLHVNRMFLSKNLKILLNISVLK
ncbi:hypothetical protein SAMN05216600_116106 [Pseudomonas cuatrocienegasensis]|uniref:Uncharacterized protein n=1 Tax=Pseudomonas cuatrocienegasensis TaxID=543360 RepID=A0ABY1BM91_9PSED|nr:hypothetical protein SAMN05216600_116106 [Pseudomonas cuatrocienegasensis]